LPVTDGLTIRFPTEEEEERSRRFTVHKNYLGSLTLLLGLLYGRDDALLEGLVQAQQRLPAFRRVAYRRLTSESELRRLLSIAWASELQLRLASYGGGAFLRYSNAWTPVQAYYSVYMSVHAWLLTIGMSGLVDDHTRTLRTIVSHSVQRGLLPHPWTVTCEGCPELGERRIIGLPANANADQHVELLATPVLSDVYPRLAKMLETTRDLRLQRLRREWLRANGRQRMPAAAKRAAGERLHATTLFDYLWRLRIRANYGDVSAFLMSSVDERDHEVFHGGLVRLTEASCLLFESLIATRIGCGPYAAAVDEFLAGGGNDLGEPARFLDARRQAICG
jgi:hypothetical protein